MGIKATYPPSPCPPKAMKFRAPQNLNPCKLLFRIRPGLGSSARKCGVWMPVVLDLRVGLVYTTSIASVIFTSTRMTATPATAGAATPSYCSSFLYDSGSDNQANRGTPPWCQHQRSEAQQTRLTSPRPKSALR